MRSKMIFFRGKQEILAGISADAKPPNALASVGADWSTSSLRQIFLPQNLHVVQLVSGGKKGHAANRNAVFVGVALAHPSLLRQVLKERDGGLANAYGIRRSGCSACAR